MLSNSYQTPTTLTGLSSLPPELVDLILRRKLEDYADFTTDPRQRRERYSFLRVLTATSKTLYQLVRPLLLEYVWIGTLPARKSWRFDGTVRDHVGTLVLEYDEVNEDLQEMLARCETLRRLELLVRFHSRIPRTGFSQNRDLGAERPSTTTIKVVLDPLKDVEGLSSLQVSHPACLASDDPNLSSLNLSCIEFENPQTAPSVYDAFFSSSRNTLKTLKVKVNYAYNAHLHFFSTSLPLVMPNLEHLTLEAWSTSREKPSMKSFKLAKRLRTLDLTSAWSTDADLIMDALGVLPEDCPLQELKLENMVLVKRLLESDTFRSAGLKRLRTLRAHVGSYGTMSYPTLPKVLVQVCDTRDLEVITIDPFGEERHPLFHFSNPLPGGWWFKVLWRTPATVKEGKMAPIAILF